MLTVSPSQALLVPALSICCCLSALLHPIYLPLNLLPLLVVIGCHRDLGQNQTTLSQRRKAVLVRDGRQTHLNRLEGVSAVGGGGRPIHRSIVIWHFPSPRHGCTQLHPHPTWFRFLVPVCGTPLLAEAIASRERITRVSFADTASLPRFLWNRPRPSTHSRRTNASFRPSPAFHFTYAPPVPSLPCTVPRKKVKRVHYSPKTVVTASLL